MVLCDLIECPAVSEQVPHLDPPVDVEIVTIIRLAADGDDMVVGFCSRDSVQASF